VDPHVHLIPGGLLLSSINLRDLKGGRQEFAQRVAAAAAAAAAGGSSGSSSDSSGGFSVSDRSSWLIGMGWSESDWGGELPNRSWVDEVSRTVPAVIGVV
jgi:predicted amidohydrolase YtcJ